MSATTPFSLSSVDAYICVLSQKCMEIIFQLSVYRSYGKQMGSCIFTLKQGVSSIVPGDTVDWSQQIRLRIWNF